MPTADTLALFALASFALIAIPGPNMLYIVTRGVAEGRRSAIVSALGVETACSSTSARRRPGSRRCWPPPRSRSTSSATRAPPTWSTWGSSR